MVATTDIADCVGCGLPVVFDYEETKKARGLIYCPDCEMYFSLQQSILIKHGIADFDEDDEIELEAIMIGEVDEDSR